MGNGAAARVAALFYFTGLSGNNTGLLENTFGVSQNTLGIICGMPNIPPFFRRPSNTFSLAFQQVLESLPAKIA